MKKFIILATALVLGASATAFANENENGASIYVAQYANGMGAFAQQVPARVRQPAATITDGERAWFERSTKNIGNE
jgi:hypothetical protein